MLDLPAPQAVAQLAKLLRNKSGYVRLEAMSDILNCNSIGTSKEAPKTAPPVVNINLDATVAGRSVPLWSSSSRNCRATRPEVKT
jgi:hypothetical protein